MEIWDAYLKDGSLAGRDLVRGEPIPDGLYHLCCEILVRHTDGDYLLMERAPDKEPYGGYIEASAGGSALKGEDPLTCAKRELFEETGITAEELSEFGVSTVEKVICHSFLCVTDHDKGAVTLQEGETVSSRWVNEEEFKAFVASDKMMDTQRIRYRDFLSRMGYL